MEYLVLQIVAMKTHAKFCDKIYMLALATQQSPSGTTFTQVVYSSLVSSRGTRSFIHSCIEISYINKYYNASSFLRNIKYSISMSSLLTFCHALQLQKDILKTFSKLSSSKTVYKATVLRIKKAKSPR